MAQINFPEATADGQQFEADNGVIYTYVGVPPNGYWSGTFQDQALPTLDGRYLKLDSSNDPLTNGLTVEGNVKLDNSGELVFDSSVSGTTTTRLRFLEDVSSSFSFQNSQGNGPNLAYYSTNADNTEYYYYDFAANGPANTNATTYYGGQITTNNVGASGLNNWIGWNINGNNDLGAAGIFSAYRANITDQTTTPYTFAYYSNVNGTYSDAAKKFHFYGATDVPSYTAGYWGLGTENPSSPIHIKDTAPSLKFEDTQQDADNASVMPVYYQSAFSIQLRDNSNNYKSSAYSFTVNGNNYVNKHKFFFGAASQDIFTEPVTFELTGGNQIEATVPGRILTKSVVYSSNQDKPYLIAGAKTYTGATTNWGTYGFQHRFKSNSGGSGRVTIDSNSGEIACFTSANNVGIGTSDPSTLLHVNGNRDTAFGRVATLACGSDNNFKLTTANGSLENSNGESTSRLGVYYTGGGSSGWDGYIDFVRGGSFNNGAVKISAGSSATTLTIGQAGTSASGLLECKNLNTERTQNILGNTGASILYFNETQTAADTSVGKTIYENIPWSWVRDSNALSARWNNTLYAFLAEMNAAGTAINNVKIQGNAYRFGSTIVNFGLAAEATSTNWSLCVAGRLQSNGTYNATTASAANVNIASNGLFIRSTSSAKYKTDVETMESSYSDKILDARPVWYRSLCDADPDSHSYWGFIAEEIAEIDPRLVQWKTTEIVETGEEPENEGDPIPTKAVECEPTPEGVSYDRFVPHLVDICRRQRDQIAALEERLSALEAK